MPWRCVGFVRPTLQPTRRGCLPQRACARDGSGPADVSQRAHVSLTCTWYACAAAMPHTYWPGPLP